MGLLPAITALSDDSEPEQAPKAKPRPKPSKVKAAMKRPSASSAAGEDGANPEAESKSAMKRPSASPADGANLEPMSEAEESDAQKEERVAKKPAMKRPAAAARGEIAVSNPYYYKNNNSWGLKMSNREVLRVGGVLYNKGKTREIAVAAQKELAAGKKVAYVKEMVAIMQRELMNLNENPKEEDAAKQAEGELPGEESQSSKKQKVEEETQLGQTQAETQAETQQAEAVEGQDTDADGQEGGEEEPFEDDPENID
ncbi:unnamed protein product [Effrenium voratum]|uniref:Uncharacterized protein n=1 Tax=Effrenium voratum TaxID=2562239 RepID=A0AA36MKU0_9DINO|nr:unnamed protein product [Effrenium voratum]